ncbi:MAG: hypothetical protein ABI230_07830 [Aestuariivirga sp.]
MSDNAELAAQLSCLLTQRGHYLSIVEAPRAYRPDPMEELNRKTNAIARSRATRMIFAGVPSMTSESLTNYMTPALRRHIKVEVANTVADVQEYGSLNLKPLKWGRERIGIGLLSAMRERRLIVFGDEPSPSGGVSSKSEHVVICEEGEPISEVIAANYAYALNAGLFLIPSVSRADSDDLLEEFYSAYESNVSIQGSVERLRDKLTSAVGSVEIPIGGSITFISGGLPYGFGVRHVPSTHLFKFPDLGTAVINGFAAEQADAPQIGLVALVNPEKTPAGEIEVAKKFLPPRGAFLRGYEGNAADVRTVGKLLDWLPYELLIIATHCGDAAGFRWTCKFKDSQGKERVFVVDVAPGMGAFNASDKQLVTHFIRFVSLDGVDWNDPDKSKKLQVGTAVYDLLQKIGDPHFRPVKSERIDRVVGSSALKMSDGNLILLPKPLADEGTPIVINNACSSWHRLAGDMIYGNARAYIGTLYPVLSHEAESVISKLLQRHFDKPLPNAIWSAQREVYGKHSDRRPYVIAGVYPQRLRFGNRGFFPRIIGRLRSALEAWLKNQEWAAGGDVDRTKMIDEAVDFYRTELAHFEHLAQSNTPQRGA